MAFTRDILDRMASDGEIQIRLEKCCVFFGCGQRQLNPGWLMISLGIKKTGNISLGDYLYHLHLRHIVGGFLSETTKRGFFFE